MGRLMKIGIGVAIISLGLIVMFSMSKSEDAVGTLDKVETVNVSTTVAKPASIPYLIEVTGSLQAKRKVELYSEVQGILLPNQRAFKEGNRFSKNQVLLKIDAGEYIAQVQSSKSGFMGQVAAMLPDMEMEFPEAYKKWEVYLKAFDMDGQLQPLPDHTSESEKLFLTGKGIYEAYYNVRNQQERALKYSIRAPFSGTVTESNVNAGTLVRSGQKLGEFIDPSNFELRLAIPEAAAKYVELGKRVILQTIQEDASFEGEIIRMNKKIDQATQTIDAIVGLSDDRLRDGQYLKARISGNEISDAIKIKNNLILENNHVYLVKDSLLTLQKIRAMNYENDSVVIQGIPKGTLLLNEVLANAYPGMKVNY